MHTHTHTHVYKRIDVQIHTHMHIYTYIMSAHINTYTYIHTRIQNVHMNTRKARMKRRRCSDTKKFCPSPCPHHDSALSRPHPLICTGAEPIHQVHCPRQLPALPWPPETRSFFCHFGGVSLVARCRASVNWTNFTIILLIRKYYSHLVVLCRSFVTERFPKGSEKSKVEF